MAEILYVRRYAATTYAPVPRHVAVPRSYPWAAHGQRGYGRAVSFVDAERRTMGNPADGIFHITHEDPAWRPASGHIAMVDLASFGFENQQEQVWLRPLDEDEYELCCIPFRVYGLALGDRVRVVEGRFVADLAARSGRRVFRVFFADPRPPASSPDSREPLRAAIRAGGFLAEWSGDRHVAIDIPPSSDPSRLFSAVEAEIRNQSAYWEWADSSPFRVSGR